LIYAVNQTTTQKALIQTKNTLMTSAARPFVSSAWQKDFKGAQHPLAPIFQVAPEYIHFRLVGNAML
jgi:hypothetical protein